jgi:pilus assembly protein FimV
MTLAGWLVVLIGLVFGPFANAASLGQLSVTSALGQPLRAELDVTFASEEEADSAAVRLAPVSAFSNANLDFNPALSSLQFALEKQPSGRSIVRVTSTAPVNEPYLDLLIELNTASGRVIREYTMLLDPPGLKRDPDVISPSVVAGGPLAPAESVAAPPPVAAAPVPAAAETQVTPAPTGTAQPLVPPGRSESVPPAEVTAERGDTLMKIARAVKSDSVSLDQMVVALYRANPQAFRGRNMNRLVAGSSLRIPDADKVMAAGSSAAARRVVVAQSRDFARYRSRLVGAATPTRTPGAQTAARGRVRTKVENGSAQPSGDQLKIASAQAKSAGDKARAADEAVARNRQIQELQERIRDLEQTNTKLQQALELKSRIGAQAQATAEAKKAPGELAQPAAAATAAAGAKSETKPAPSAAPAAPADARKVAEAPAAMKSETSAEPAKPVAAASAPAPAPAVSATTTAPTTAAPATTAPAAPVVAPPKAGAVPPKSKKAPAPPDNGGFFSDLWENSGPYILGGLAAVLLGALALVMLRRRAKNADEDMELTNALASELLPDDEMHAAEKKESVAVPAQASRESRAAFAADHPDFDPVAEADVYFAYGRTAEAIEMLKSTIRANPQLIAAKLKLLEIYAGAQNKAAFDELAQDIKAQTHGQGEQWHIVNQLGHSLYPESNLYKGAAVGAAAAHQTRGGEFEKLDQSLDDPATDPLVDLDLNAPATSPAKTAMTGGGARGASTVGHDALAITGAPTDSPLTFEGLASGPGGASTQKLGAPLAPRSLPDLDLTLPAPSAPRVAEARPTAAMNTSTNTRPGPITVSPTTSIEFASSASVSAEMTTMLDLARGYIDLGLADGARELLEDVRVHGTNEQRRDAAELLQKLGAGGVPAAH